MYIGNILKKIRNEMNLTQEEMAKKLDDLSIHTYRKYEQDLREPKFDMLQKIADALEISVNDLTGTSETFENDFDIESFDDEVKQYIINYRNALKEENNNKITNTLILQNIIIDRIADEWAQRTLGIFPLKRDLNEFSKDDKGNMITGQELKLELIEVYRKKYLEEKLERKLEGLKKDFSNIYHSSGESLEKYKEIYNDIPKNMIDRYILEKLYPEYLKESDEENNRIKEIIRKNDEATGLDQETLKKLKTMEIVKKD